MPRTRLHAPLAAALAIAGLLATVPCGVAATRLLPTDIDANPRGGALEYGTATLVLSGGAASTLKSAGATLSASGSAKVKGTKITFQGDDKRSFFDPTNMRGLVVGAGSLTIKGKKGSAKLTNITFQPGIEKDVTAKLGGKLIELGSLTGGKAKFSGLSDGKLTNARIKLTAKAASKLNAKTGGGLQAGTLGALTIDATTRELPIAGGTATLNLDPAILRTINDAGFEISAEAPAARNGLQISLAILSGAFDPEGLTGRLSMDGKIDIGKPGLQVSLYNFRAAVGTSQHELFGSINDAVAAPIADLDVSTMVSQFGNDGGYTATGAKLTLSTIALSVLKQQFGVALPAGTSLGTVDLAGKLSGHQ